MKKNLLWMLAAILCCGLTTIALTSCGSDDDPEEQNGGQGEKKATKGDVTLTFVAQPKALTYFEYDFKYVDAKGNTKTIDIDQDTQSSGSLDDFEFKAIKDVINVLAANPEYADLNNPFVYRVVLKDQPVGSTVTYTTTCHVKEGASISETLVYALPSVMPSIKLENSNRELASAFAGFKGQRVSPEQWEQYVSAMEGKVIVQGSGEVVVGE